MSETQNDLYAREQEDLSKLKLNKATRYDGTPDDTPLETFKKKTKYTQVIEFRCPEFTTLCPITSQPDFGNITIQYIADEDCVESKSLKLYLFSFRQCGNFHEDVVNRIMSDIVDATNPLAIRVVGDFGARGGISIHPVSSYAREGHEHLLGHILNFASLGK